MGYLDNSSITVDAILTKRGRELLAKNDGSFRITQFALADDEIDYSMFNENHPNGTQYAAEAIENMPLIEAIPEGSSMMNSKLITLVRGTSQIPYIKIGAFSEGTAASVDSGNAIALSPQTWNYQGNDAFMAEPGGYIFTLLNDNLGTIAAIAGTADTPSGTQILQYTEIPNAISVKGTTMTFNATTSNTLFSTTVTSIASQIIVEGVDTGAKFTLPIIVTKP